MQSYKLDNIGNIHFIEFYGYYVLTEAFLLYLQNPKLSKEYIINNFSYHKIINRLYKIHNFYS